MSDARKNYHKSRRYYKRLLKERITNYIDGTIEILLLLTIIIASFQLVHMALTSERTIDRLNECYKYHSYSYCQKNVK